MDKRTKQDFEFEEQIEKADADTLRRIVRAVAIARAQWWNADDCREADGQYIDAIGVALFSEFE